MTTTSEVDYALVVEEMTTLNRLFSRDHGTTLHPEYFEKIRTDATGIIVIFGKRSGTYHMAEFTTANGWDRYGRFSPAEPRTRTVTDWVWA